MRSELITEGIHYDVSAEVYYQPRRGVARNSGLAQIARSPAHYLAWLESDRVTPALEFGRMLHSAILEPSEFQKNYVVAPDFGDCRFKDNKATRDAWLANNHGLTVVDAEQHAKILGMSQAILAHPIASKLLGRGRSEVTCSWTDEATGIPCLSRVDRYLPELATAVDLKSAEDASPEAFRRSVARYGYHRQDAFYSRGFARLGAPLKHFAFVVAEKAEPYAVAVYVLDSDAVASGNESINRDMATFKSCLESGKWPAYSEGIQTLSLPPWAA